MDSRLLASLQNFATAPSKLAVLGSWFLQERRGFLSALLLPGLDPALRVLAWMRALGLLGETPAAWPQQLADMSHMYVMKLNALNDAFLMKQGAVARDDHPLSLDAKTSRFARYYRLLSCEKLVEKDVSRLFSADPFYSDPAVRREVARACLLWSHSTGCTYRQGVHEVLALLYKACCDAYRASGAILDDPGTLGAIFEIADRGRAGAPPPEPRPGSLLVTGVLQALRRAGPRPLTLALGTELFAALYAWYDEGASTHMGLHTKVAYLVDHLLLRSDPALHAHLAHIHAETVGLLPWYRLLFAREVPLVHVHALWDVIFWDWAACYPLHICDYIALGLLHVQREKLMAGDYGDCMQALCAPAMPSATRADVELLARHAMGLSRLAEGRDAPATEVIAAPAPGASLYALLEARAPAADQKSPEDLRFENQALRSSVAAYQLLMTQGSRLAAQVQAELSGAVLSPRGREKLSRLVLLLRNLYVDNLDGGEEFGGGGAGGEIGGDAGSSAPSDSAGGAGGKAGPGASNAAAGLPSPKTGGGADGAAHADASEEAGAGVGPAATAAPQAGLEPSPGPEARSPAGPESQDGLWAGPARASQALEAIPEVEGSSELVGLFDELPNRDEDKEEAGQGSPGASLGASQGASPAATASPPPQPIPATQIPSLSFSSPSPPSVTRPRLLSHSAADRPRPLLGRQLSAANFLPSLAGLDAPVLTGKEPVVQPLSRERRRSSVRLSRAPERVAGGEPPPLASGSASPWRAERAGTEAPVTSLESQVRRVTANSQSVSTVLGAFQDLEIEVDRLRAENAYLWDQVQRMDQLRQGREREGPQ